MKDKGSLDVTGLSPSEANRSLRIQLAAAHRGLAEFGLNDRIVNHLSVRAPAANGEGEILLITPFPIDFKDVTPACLLGINVETGAVDEGDGSLHQISGSFHRGLYLSRPQTNCMMHTHSPHVCAIASLEDPRIMMLNQTILSLYNRIQYDYDFGGLVNDLNEGKRLGELLGDEYDNLIMMHHGSLSVGKSISWAFNDQIALEISARNQILAMQTGRKIQEIPKEMCEFTASQFKTLHDTAIVDAHLLSVIKKLQETYPAFE